MRDSELNKGTGQENALKLKTLLREYGIAYKNWYTAKEFPEVKKAEAKILALFKKQQKGRGVKGE